MKGLQRTVTPALVVLVLGACGGSYPGGARGNGGAGADGGSGGTADPVPVTFPAFTVNVRSQLWAPAFDRDGLLPSAYQLLLLDEARACSAEGLRIVDDEGWVAISLVDPALGACEIRTDAEWSEPPSGCLAYVDAGIGAGARQSAIGGFVRVDRIDRAVLAGELHLQVPEGTAETLGCWGRETGDGAGGRPDFEAGCDCVGPDGPFSCESAEPWVDCCEDGFPVLEITVPFEATRCADATSCQTRSSVPYLVGACQPEPVTPPSCEAACDAYVSTCLDCLGCTQRDCENAGTCARDRCLDTCHNLAGADPLVSLSLSCVETAASCGDWASCVSSCGP